jgi:site-specific DNA recombinase
MGPARDMASPDRSFGQPAASRRSLERRKKDLEAFLLEAGEPPPLLHLSMAHHYRAQMEDLYQELQEDSEAKQTTAAEIIRSMVKEIILTPEDSELAIEVSGDLAGILHVAVSGMVPVRSAQRKRPAVVAGRSQFEMDAGTGFEPVTFRL